MKFVITHYSQSVIDTRQQVPYKIGSLRIIQLTRIFVKPVK